MDSRQEIAAGIAQLEGYLLCQTEIANARAEAEAFARRLPWLTTSQHEEVVALYSRERVELSRRVLRGVADRCRSLRGEYEARYAQLRARLLCVTVATVLAALAACVCALLFTRVG
ncbi:hypothetical protein [Wenjunlia tyrosinilytica]|uniref:Cytochrome C oxidase subunit I n=1 Tax=Wenjunlia tyrosinilytica TaxID=1544741 RepID=A0A917ZRV3_9ACTN|nr:hypothetical protein [Wenjunlia tyrosinilytica]GGO90210.1 hypothetical protein GCM10012280_35210 [Wenjunlia tyrosinilytica]